MDSDLRLRPADEAAEGVAIAIGVGSGGTFSGGNTWLAGEAVAAR
jgi:hypothetical protein